MSLSVPSDQLSPIKASNIDMSAYTQGSMWCGGSGGLGILTLGNGLSTDGTVFSCTITNVSQLTNDANYITAGGAPVQSVNGQTGAVTIAANTFSAPLVNTSGVVSLSYSTGLQNTAGSLTTVPRSFSYPTRSIVTTTASTGFQPGSSRDCEASYAVQITTTSNISSGTQGTIYLEIAATNSTTPSAWSIIDQQTSGQTFSLAVAVQCVQIQSVKLNGVIPAGYYARIRSANTVGTPTFSVLVSAEVLI
jgi:hypothetical protein